jgi:hypothetical protein
MAHASWPSRTFSTGYDYEAGPVQSEHVNADQDRGDRFGQFRRRSLGVPWTIFLEADSPAAQLTSACRMALLEDANKATAQ